MTFDKNKNQTLDYLEISPALTAAGESYDTHTHTHTNASMSMNTHPVHANAFIDATVIENEHAHTHTHTHTHTQLSGEKSVHSSVWAHWEECWWSGWSELVCSGLGIQVDEFIMQLIGLRYTEPDMSVSFPGFLFLLMKLDCMMRKRAHK